MARHRTRNDRKQIKINFLKENEELVREVFTNVFTHNCPIWIALVMAAKKKGIYGNSTVPRQIYVNLYQVATKDIGWNFLIK